jgi:Ulp1 family protease
LESPGDKDIVIDGVVGAAVFTTQSELDRVLRFKIPLQLLDDVRRRGTWISNTIVDVWTGLANGQALAQTEYLICTTTVQIVLAEDRPLPISLVRAWKDRWVPSQHSWLLIPFFVCNSHFVLLAVDAPNSIIYFLDSLKSRRDRISEQTWRNVESFMESVAGCKRPMKRRTLETPQQVDGDCGIFLIEFMRSWCKGLRERDELAAAVSASTIHGARQRILTELQNKRVEL